MDYIPPITYEATFCIMNLVQFLGKEKKISLTMIEKICRIPRSDFSLIFECRSPKKLNLIIILNQLMKLKAHIDRFERIMNQKDIYNYLADALMNVPPNLDADFYYADSPNNYEPVSYSEKHGGEVCAIF